MFIVPPASPAAGHGGQVLLSQTTHALIDRQLPEGVGLRDLGAYRLKDLQRPERIFQLLHPNLPADFSPLKSLDTLPNNQFAQAIAAQLRAVKVRASVRTLDWPTYIANLDAPPDQTKLQLFALAWVPFPPDCWWVLFPNFHSSQRPGMNNAMFYANAKVDRLLDKARTELDPSRRKTLLKEAQTIVWHDAPWVFLWNQKWYVATARNLQGVSITPFEMFDAIYATWK